LPKPAKFNQRTNLAKYLVQQPAYAEAAATEAEEQGTCFKLSIAIWVKYLNFQMGRWVFNSKNHNAYFYNNIFP
jgi:hypothetical protein